MKNNREPHKLTLPLLSNYVTQLSSTLNNDKNKNADLLWVMEDKAALATLNAQASTTASHIIANSATTLLSLVQQTTHTRYQLSCFWLPTLTEQTLQPYIPLLMRYRDLYAAHLIIGVSQEIDLRQYGFIPFSVFNDEQANAVAPLESMPSPIKLWQFNLYDYKSLPNWLNSDYWANPENWDKQRW